MAGKKPAYTDLKPNEVLPLDFCRVQGSELEPSVMPVDEQIVEGMELFEGVDIQPKSDTPGTMPSESTENDEESSE